MKSTQCVVMSMCKWRQEHVMCRSRSAGLFGGCKAPACVMCDAFTGLTHLPNDPIDVAAYAEKGHDASGMTSRWTLPCD